MRKLLQYNTKQKKNLVNTTVCIGSSSCCIQSSQLELKQYVPLGLRHVWKQRGEGWDDSSRIVLGEQLVTGGRGQATEPRA